MKFQRLLVGAPRTKVFVDVLYHVVDASISNATRGKGTMVAVAVSLQVEHVKMNYDVKTRRRSYIRVA